MRISDCSSDVCSFDLDFVLHPTQHERRKFFVALDQTVLAIAKALEIVRREAAFEFPARAKKTGIDRIGNRPQVLQPVLDRYARHRDLDCAVQRLCGAATGGAWGRDRGCQYV